MNSKNMKNKFFATAVVVSALILTGCASQKAINVAEDNSVTNQNITFPDPSRSWVSEGDFVNLENLRKVVPGLTKDQLYYLINRPHFTEGLFGVDKWNYLFNFRTGVNNEYVTCQYQIHFDKNRQVTSTYWKEPGCARFLEPKQEVVREVVREVVKEPVAMEAPPIQRFTIAGDVLFAYNRHNLSDLRLGGRAELDRILAELRNYKSIDLVRVIGHTDPLATFEYNFDLAYKRANTVVDYFAANGIKRDVLQARSAGETEIIKASSVCGAKYANVKTGKNDKFLQECLAPNRRVVVEVTGVKN
jgi:OmpA-OmpF porin, OOP family